MSNFKAIRDQLGMTQAAIGAELGVTQGNVSFYEKGQTVPPDIAKKLIDVAGGHGLTISFDDIYGDHILREYPTPPEPEGKLAKFAEAS